MIESKLKTAKRKLYIFRYEVPSLSLYETEAYGGAVLALALLRACERGRVQVELTQEDFDEFAADFAAVTPLTYLITIIRPPLAP